jgi:hypothetical protein
MLSKIKTYINSIIERVLKPVGLTKSALHRSNEWCIINGVYLKTLEWFANVVLSGIIVWVMLVPFIGITNPVYIISYGLVPWFIIRFIKELR